MELSLKWVVLWSLWAARLVRQPTVPLLVSNGWLTGNIDPEGTYSAYYGIPYATVLQRFQAPGPEPKWTDIFEAKNEHIHCSQLYRGWWLSGQEDCLTLNVYTPLPTTRNLLPVMIFIHGGSFREGSSNTLLFGPDHFMKKRVILVTINYRLAIFGFLCLGIKEAPGNAGLKDQLAALKWIKNNIRAFGGDTDNITLFGESAGASSTLFHIISPLSKGLFQKTILQSGSPLASWSLQFEPLNLASRFALQMGYNTTDPHELYNIFKNKSSIELLKTILPRTKGDMLSSEVKFVPCVEKKINDIEQFLPDTPYNLMVSGQYNKIPMIMGYNDAEGYLFAGIENETTIRNMNFYTALPKNLVFPSEKERVETAMKVKEIYMGDEEITSKTLHKFAFYVGDSCITYHVLATMELMIRTSEVPVYMYKMCYDGGLNIAKFVSGFRGYPGMTHADDLFYMFKPKLTIPANFYETRIINKITTLWTNFAKYSDPTPEVTSLLPLKWRPVNKTDAHALVIDKEFSTAPQWSSNLLFWNATYSKYRRKS